MDELRSVAYSEIRQLARLGSPGNRTLDETRRALWILWRSRRKIALNRKQTGWMQDAEVEQRIVE
eukprot:3406858-Lingulodinium_polyedra.AAC.1